jgi:hypothetical protein
MTPEQEAYYRLLDAAAEYLRTMGIDSMVLGRPEMRHDRELVIPFTPGGKLI